MLLICPFLAYVVVVSLVALPVIAKARRAMLESAAAPDGQTTRTAVATCVSVSVVHLLAQVVPPVIHGEYDEVLVLVYGWVGPLGYLVAIAAVALLVIGRRRGSQNALSVARAAAVSLYLFAPLAVLEVFILRTLGLPRVPY